MVSPTRYRIPEFKTQEKRVHMGEDRLRVIISEYE